MAEVRSIDLIPRPMLAASLSEDIRTYYTNDWVMEPKLDGRRLMVRKQAGVLTAWHRPPQSATNGNLVDLPPHLGRVLQERLPDGCIVDGEEHIPGGTVSDVATKANDPYRVLTMFDMVMLDGQRTTGEPYTNRRELLMRLQQKCFARTGRIVNVIENYPVDLARVKRWWAKGMEGAIVKHVGAHYFPGKRVDRWIKVKRIEFEDMYVIGFEAGGRGLYSKIKMRGEHSEVTCKVPDNVLRSVEANPGAYIHKTLRVRHNGTTKDGKYLGVVWIGLV